MRTHLGPLRGEMNWAAAAYSVSVLVQLLTRRGLFEEAEALLAEGDPEPWPASTNLQYFLRAARGELRCAQGRYEEGVADLSASRHALMRFNRYSGALFMAVHGKSETLALDASGRREETDCPGGQGHASSTGKTNTTKHRVHLRMRGCSAGGKRGMGFR